VGQHCQDQGGQEDKQNRSTPSDEVKNGLAACLLQGRECHVQEASKNTSGEEALKISLFQLREKLILV
jgi:hypothetical protein